MSVSILLRMDPREIMCCTEIERLPKESRFCFTLSMPPSNSTTFREKAGVAPKNLPPSQRYTIIFSPFHHYPEGLEIQGSLETLIRTLIVSGTVGVTVIILL